MTIEYQQLDHDIEIAMFDIEFYQAQLDFLWISHGSRFRLFISTMISVIDALTPIKVRQSQPPA